ncbi:TPA: hypothetical protein ACHOZM_004995 [Raoultella ornithinolytica]
MKPVTVETVRARIDQIEHAINTMPGGFTLSINHEFELACLRELLARLEGKGVTVKRLGERCNEDGVVTSEFDRGWNAYDNANNLEAK